MATDKFKALAESTSSASQTDIHKQCISVPDIDFDESVADSRHTWRRSTINATHDDLGTQRLPYSLGAPTESSDSIPSAIGVPSYHPVRSLSRHFPSSPFVTPQEEAPLSLQDEEDVVIYPTERMYYGQINSIADTVVEPNIVVHDEEDEEYVHQISPASPCKESSPQTVISSPREFDVYWFHTTTPNTTSPLAVNDNPDSLKRVPRLSVSSRGQSNRSPLAIKFDTDSELTVPETPLEESALGARDSVSRIFATGSLSSGRRTRVNSIATQARKPSTDSNISRQSGRSLASSKAEKTERGTRYPWCGQQPVVPSSFASSSMWSLLAPSGHCVYHIPPASNPDLSKYGQDAKLFPFPGITKLEQQSMDGRNRRGLSTSSVPDVSLSRHVNKGKIPLPSSSASHMRFNSLDVGGNRVFDHQTQNSRVFSKFKNLVSPVHSTAPPSSWKEAPSKQQNSIGGWRKMLGALKPRSDRRSRTDSIHTRERGQIMDSQISQQSGRSIASSNGDKNDLGSRYPLRGQQSVAQSSSASSSMWSLALSTPPGRNDSPILLASNPDLAEYRRDANSFPFPGLKKLEEECLSSRHRLGVSITSSTPDSILSPHGNENETQALSSSPVNARFGSPGVERELVLDQRASGGCLSRFGGVPSLSTSPSLLSPVIPPKREHSIERQGKIMEGSDSRNGRLSPTNSMATRGRKQSTDSSVSRQSGRSLGNSEVGMNEFASPYPPGVRQTVTRPPSASSSLPSLELPMPPRRDGSPTPLISNSNLAKYYQDAKLFPFPGIKKLEQQRTNSRRLRGLSMSSSVPENGPPFLGNMDAIPPPSTPFGHTRSRSHNILRDRVLDCHTSDTRYQPKPTKNLDSMYQSVSSSSPFDHSSGARVSSSQSPSSVRLNMLPNDLQGVRKWFNDRFGSSKLASADDTLSPTSQTICATAIPKKFLPSEEEKNDLNSDSDDFCSPEERKSSRGDGTLSSGNPRAHGEGTREHEKTVRGAVRLEKRCHVEGHIGSTFPGDLLIQISRDGDFPVAAGGCADIYKGTLHAHPKTIKVAIKAIKVYSAEDNHYKKTKRLRREVKVWMKLSHANVLPLFGITSGFGPFPAMVCPWLENGPLTSYLERWSVGLEILQILALIHDVTSGLQYLHSQSIIHGDLSGSNVLIDATGRACIADFGLSTVLDELGGSTFVASSAGKPRGTLRWAAPELLDLVDHGDVKSLHAGPTVQSDIYSFGGIMLQILSGKVPYHYYSRDMQIVAAIYRGETPTRPDNPNVTDHRWQFIQRCWSPLRIVFQRPSSEDIVAFSNDDLVWNSPQAF